MSFQSWTDHGYGVNLDALNVHATADGIRKLLDQSAPLTKKLVLDALSHLENVDGGYGVRYEAATVGNFTHLDIRDEFPTDDSISQIVCCAINEMFGCEYIKVGVFSTDIDKDDRTYVIVEPRYPWGGDPIYDALTKDAIVKKFARIFEDISEGTVSPDVDFQTIKNFC